MAIQPYAVVFDRVSRSYGNVQALRDVSFTISPGETIALLGPNGAGKTTAISILLGLRPPTSGSAAIFGESPRKFTGRERIGAMLQESGVPSTLTVTELITWFSKMYSNPKPLGEVLEVADLSSKANARSANLSGGERQRLYFALSLVGNPDLLFLDEPTNGLDVDARRRFWQYISGLIQQKKTIVVTTHYLEEADAIAQRIIMINHGNIIAQGNSQQIKSLVSGKKVRFRSNLITESSVMDLPSVRAVSKINNLYEVTSDIPEETVKMLLNTISDVSDLEVSSMGLEEAFIVLTTSSDAQLQQKTLHS